MMRADALDFTNVDEFCTMLAGVDGVRTASTDPAKVHTPGVWVSIDDAGLSRLTVMEYRLTCYLVVGDVDHVRNRINLADLHNLLLPTFDSVGGIAGAVQLAGLTLPASSAPLPALRVPIVLSTTNPTEE